MCDLLCIETGARLPLNQLYKYSSLIADTSRTSVLKRIHNIAVP